MFFTKGDEKMITANCDACGKIVDTWQAFFDQTFNDKILCKRDKKKVKGYVETMCN